MEDRADQHPLVRPDSVFQDTRQRAARDADGVPRGPGPNDALTGQPDACRCAPTQACAQLGGRTCGTALASYRSGANLKWRQSMMKRRILAGMVAFLLLAGVAT